LPKTRLNGATSYALARQWLAALSVDMKRLEADYPSRVYLTWDMGDRFVPLYTVEWSRPVENSSRRDVAATVEVLEAERSLEQLAIEKPEYMTRAPLVVPDRDMLLKPGKVR
jgi:hypothetical protein